MTLFRQRSTHTQPVDQLLADEIVSRCVESHRGRFQIDGITLILFNVLIVVGLMSIFQWHGGPIGAMFGCMAGIIAAIAVNLVLQIFEVIPNWTGDPLHWNRYAASNHLRTMELALPPNELKQWKDLFAGHVRSGKAVIVKDLVDFANKLRCERINQTILREQSMVVDVNTGQ